MVWRIKCIRFWKEAILNYKDEELEIALGSIKHIPINPNILIDILIKLIGDLDFTAIRIIEKVNRERFSNSKLGMVFSLFMRIIAGSMENYDKYKREEIYNEIQNIELPHGDMEHEIYYYSIYAVVASYLQPAVDRIIISQRVLDKFLEKHPHRDRNYYGVWFNSLCMWQFLCGRKHSENEARLVSLVSVYEKDNSVGILADMSCGYYAERKDEKSEWIIRKEDEF